MLNFPDITGKSFKGGNYMRKRIFAILLIAAMFMEGIALPAAGEELAVDEEGFTEDTVIGDASVSIADEEISAADAISEELVTDETAEEDLYLWSEEEELILDDETIPDELIEETAEEEDLIPEEITEEDILSNLYDADDKEEIIESVEEEEVFSEVGDVLTDTDGLIEAESAKWQAAENFRDAAQSIIASMVSFSDEPDLVGSTSATKVNAAALLKACIERSNQIDEEGNHYITGTTKISGISATAGIYYLEQDNEFYFVLKMDQTIDGIKYVSEVSMTIAYDLGYGADVAYFLDPVSAGVSMVSARVEISDPSTYKGTETLDFNVETLDTDLMDFEIQDLANDMLKAGMAYWNSLLLGNAKVSMQTLRFDKYKMSHKHSYVDVVAKAASTSKTGSVRVVCESCNNIKSVTTINKLGSISLDITKLIYNGVVLNPSVTVKDVDGGVISSDYYDLDYSNPKSKDAGTYTVTVTMKGRYSGSKTLTYTIAMPTASTPAQPKLKSASNKTNGINIQFYKVSDADSYLIYRYNRGKWSLIRTLSKKDSKLKDSGKVLSYTDTSVKTKYGSKYIYSVAAAKKGEASSFNAKGKEITRLKPPSITSTKRSGTKVTVKWSKVSCRGYILEYCDTSVKPYNFVKCKATTGRSKTVSGLKKGKVYAFRLRSYTKGSSGGTILSEYSKIKYVTVK